MDANALTETITVLRSVTQKDASGQELAVFVPFIKRSAAVSYGAAAERFAAQQVAGSAAVTFRLRFDSDTGAVTTLDRVQYRGREFDIVGGPREVIRRRFVELDCVGRSEEILDG